MMDRGIEILYTHLHKRNGVKKMKVLPNRKARAISFMKISSITILVVALLAATPVGAYYRTIVADGDPSDWAGIPPIVIDEDEAGIAQDVDISACYVANDDDNVYFRVDVFGSISEDSGNTYIIYLDTGKPGGFSVDGIEADYRVKLFSYPDCQLWVWTGTDWQFIEQCQKSGKSGNVWEVEIALSDISSSPPPATLRVVFETGIYESVEYVSEDFAPDEGYVTYWLNLFPVGGTLVPANNLSSFLPLMAIGIAAFLVVGIAIAMRKRTLSH